MALLEVSDLSVTLGSGNQPIRAVRHVDLRIERGSIHGLIGESGCGKTMTGMSILGLLPPGAVIAAECFRFDAMELRDVASSLRGRRIALISQDPAAALNPVLKIGRQMDDVLRSHRGAPRRERRAEAIELLASTGLPDPDRVLRSYPHQLSGGMQQRVVIAQALATGADFLIADEPTTALDVSVGAQVLALLRNLVADRGLTVLMITHDMDVVAKICDRTTVLYAGTTIEEGATAEVLSTPRHPYTQALLAALPDARRKGQRLAAVEGAVPAANAEIRGCAFAARCPRVMPICRDDKPTVNGAHTHRWLCHLTGRADA